MGAEPKALIRKPEKMFLKPPACRKPRLACSLVFNVSRGNINTSTPTPAHAPDRRATRKGVSLSGEIDEEAEEEDEGVKKEDEDNDEKEEEEEEEEGERSDRGG